MGKSSTEKVDTDDWTVDTVNEMFHANGDISKAKLVAFFNWTPEEREKMEEVVQVGIIDHEIMTQKDSGRYASHRSNAVKVKRLEMEQWLLAFYPQYFTNRHFPAEPDWFTAHHGSGPNATEANMHTGMQKIISRIQSDITSTQKIAQLKGEDEQLRKKNNAGDNITKTADSTKAAPKPEETKPVASSSGSICEGKKPKYSHTTSNPDDKGDILFTLAQHEAIKDARYQVNRITFEQEEHGLGHFLLLQLDWGAVAGRDLMTKGHSGLRERLHEKLSQKVGPDESVDDYELVFFDPQQGLRPTRIEDDTQLNGAVVSLLAMMRRMAAAGEDAPEIALLFFTNQFDTLSRLDNRPRVSVNPAERVFPALAQPHTTMMMPAPFNTPISSPSPSDVGSRDDEEEEEQEEEEEEDEEDGIDPDKEGTPNGQHDLDQNQDKPPEKANEDDSLVDQASAVPFPFMVYQPPLVPSQVAVNTEAPSIQLDPIIKVNRLDTMSTQASGAIQNDAAQTDNEADASAARHLRALYHFEEWEAACRFFGFDPTCESPAAGVFFPGWRKDTFLKAYQMLSTAFSLKALLQKKEFIVIAHQMGLGKTGMTLALLRLLHRLISLKKMGQLPPVDGSPLHNPFILAGQHDIKLNDGLFVVLAPGDILSTWTAEKTKFFGPSGKGQARVNQIKIVVIWGKALKRDYEEYVDAETGRKVKGRFFGAYHPEEEVDDAHRPPSEQLQLVFGNNVPEPLLVKHLINRDISGKNVVRPWLHDWGILTTPNSFWSEKKFLHGDLALQKTARVANKRAVYPHVGYIFWDEYHQIRNHTSNAYAAVAEAYGTPQRIFISGTPTTALSDIIAPCLVSTHHLYVGIGRDGNVLDPSFYRVYKPTRESKFPKAASADFNADTSDEDESRIVAEGTFWEVQEWATEADLFYNKKKANMSKVIDDDDEDDDYGAATTAMIAPPNVRRALDRWRRYWAKHAVAYTTELEWKPRPEWQGHPAVDMPFHTTWSINPGIPDTYRMALESAWKQQSADGLKNIKNGEAFRGFFFPKMLRFQVYALIPAMLQWVDEDPDLEVEMADYTSEGCVKPLISQGRTDTRLWTYMPQIDAMPAFQAMRNIIAQLRTQNNWLGDDKFKRKIVMIGFVPVLVMIIDWWLEYLVEDDTFDCLNSSTNKATIAPWAAGDKDIIVNNFRTTKDPETYQDEPFILNGSFKKIGTGLSLDPADALISYDNTWMAKDIVQCIYRIVRARMVQRATRTEAFLIRPATNWAPLHTLIDMRQRSTEELQTMIRNYLRVQGGSADDPFDLE